jgi:hypothetical protein
MKWIIGILAVMLIVHLYFRLGGQRLRDKNDSREEQ